MHFCALLAKEAQTCFPRLYTISFLPSAYALGQRRTCPTAYNTCIVPQLQLTRATLQQLGLLAGNLLQPGRSLSIALPI